MTSQIQILRRSSNETRDEGTVFSITIKSLNWRRDAAQYIQQYIQHLAERRAMACLQTMQNMGRHHAPKAMQNMGRHHAPQTMQNMWHTNHAKVDYL